MNVSTYAPSAAVRVKILQLIKFWTFCCISQTGRGAPRNLQISQESRVQDHQVIGRIHCRGTFSCLYKCVSPCSSAALNHTAPHIGTEPGQGWELVPCKYLRVACIQPPLLQSNPFRWHGFSVSPLETVRFRQDHRITDEFVCQNLHQPEKPLSAALALRFTVRKSAAW